MTRRDEHPKILLILEHFGGNIYEYLRLPGWIPGLKDPQIFWGNHPAARKCLAPCWEIAACAAEEIDADKDGKLSLQRVSSGYIYAPFFAVFIGNLSKGTGYLFIRIFPNGGFLKSKYPQIIQPFIDGFSRSQKHHPAIKGYPHCRKAPNDWFCVPPNFLRHTQMEELDIWKNSFSSWIIEKYGWIIPTIFVVTFVTGIVFVGVTIPKWYNTY